MKKSATLFACATSAILAACSSGDINITPATTVQDSNNTTIVGGGGGPNDACASYVNSSGQTISGIADDSGNCRYDVSFSSNNNPLTTDLTIPALPDGGAHIFDDSLFVGRSYSSDAELQANNIFRGGDGPTLTIAAGATLAFSDSSKFMVINRGSQLIAVGRADAPITFTSESDVNGTLTDPEAVSQWGGMVINGFGVTNKCSYTGTRGQTGFALAGECHVDSEGSAGADENQYGGANDADNSGRLEYVVVKHTGATVGNGDELNGITFGAVGSSTSVKNLQMYSTFDDGIEMFGGAVSFENYVAVYVRDDSIDVDEGWRGSITNALVVQSETDGNHCIEADGLGSFSGLPPATVEDFIARGLNSKLTIKNLTCIVSANGAGTATHDPGAGWRLREGLYADMRDSLVVATYGATDQLSGNDNYCLRIDNRSQGAALDGNLTLKNVLYSCGENTRGQSLKNPNGVDSGITEEVFATTGNAISQGGQFHPVAAGAATSPTSTANPELQLLEAGLGTKSLEWAASLINNAAPATTNNPAPATYLGGVQAGGTDWTLGWTYGIHDGRRGKALWIEGK
jgi:hypothetical protein